MYRKSDLTGQDGGTVLLKPYRAVWGEDEDEGERRRDEQEEGGREGGGKRDSLQTNSNGVLLEEEGDYARSDLSATTSGTLVRSVTLRGGGPAPL